MRVRTNDTVLVTKGRDRGKQGRVSQALPRENRIVVEGVNVVSKHTRARADLRQAGIIQKEMPIRVANVAVVYTHCSSPTRIGLRMLADGTKARICKKCQEVIE